MKDFLEKTWVSGLLAELSGIVLVLLIISALFWIVIGRFKLHNALINIYISFAILQVAMKEALSLGKLAPLGIFLILLVFLTMLDSRIFEIHLSGSGLRIWQVVILSFLEAGLFVSIVASLVPEKNVLKYVSEASAQYFISPSACIVWMTLPIIFLVVIGRRGK